MHFLNKSNSRLKNSILNFLFSFSGQILFIVLKFLVRTVFVYHFSKELLGLDSFYSSIISFLSLTELGIGTAINYALYKPISDDNKDSIIALMQLYKRTYRIIALIILILGLLMLPFLKLIIKNFPEDLNIYLIYIIYLLNTVIPYCFSYKVSFINANQQNYVVSLNHYLFSALLSLIQIVILVLTNNFYLFLLSNTIIILVEYWTLSILANKLYPILIIKKKIKLEKQTLNKIISLVNASIVVKLSSSFVNLTDSILYTRFLGLTFVGILSNYNLIINTLNNFFNTITTSLQASIGNVSAKDTQEHQFIVFNNILFFVVFVYSLIVNTYFVCIQDVIVLWLGQTFMLTYKLALLLGVNLLIRGIITPCNLFITACGLNDKIKLCSILECIINIVLSIALTLLFGEVGIILGTIISFFITSFIYLPYIIFKNVFKSNVNIYFKKMLKYILIILFENMIIVNISKYIFVSFVGIIIKGGIALIVSASIFLFMFRNSNEIIYLKTICILVKNKCFKRFRLKF